MKRFGWKKTPLARLRMLAPLMGVEAVRLLVQRTSPTPQSHSPGAHPRRQDVGLRQASCHFSAGPDGPQERKACPFALIAER